MRFDISIAVRTFVGLHEPQTIHARTREVPFEIATRGKRLSVERYWNVEIGGISIFFGSSVDRTSCVYEVRRWGKEVAGGIKCRRFSQNGEGEKKKNTSFTRPFLRGMHRAFDANALLRSAKKIYIYNNSMFIQYKK